MNILITGASGFIGSFLCEEGLRRRYCVWAAMRPHSTHRPLAHRAQTRQWLQNEWLNFVTLDLTDIDKLSQQLITFRSKCGKWDVIIHAGGSTKCLYPEEYMKSNYECTRNFIETLTLLDMLPEHFIYISSLSVLGPNLDIDNPQPNTAYGKSKLKSEDYMRVKSEELKVNSSSSSSDFSNIKTPHFNYTIFRPTGVYGPREKDYYIMVKSINRHYDFAVGYESQQLTFVYVQDLVDVIFASICNPIAYSKTYSVSDGLVYSSRIFHDLIQKELGTRFVLHITIPLFMLKIVCSVCDCISRITGKASVLNNDKYNILSQRNWLCDTTLLRQDFGFTPRWNLEHGMKETIKWYRENKWI